MLLDNKIHGNVGKTLSENISKGSRLSVITGLFSIYGYQLLKKELSRVSSFRLILSNTIGDSEESSFQARNLTGSKTERRFRNSLNISKIARECADWLRNRAQVRTVKTPVPQNLYHVSGNDTNPIAIHGSSSFTPSGLGFAPSLGYEMNTLFSTTEETNNLLSWFDSIWGDEEAVIDVKAELLRQIEEIYTSKSPELIYFITLHNIFKEYLSELQEDKIIKTRTGIKYPHSHGLYLRRPEPSGLRLSY